MWNRPAPQKLRSGRTRVSVLLAIGYTFTAGRALAVQDSRASGAVTSRPAFEVVSVKHVGGVAPGRVPRPMRFRGGRLTCEDSLDNIVKAAFHLADWEYSGPSWLKWEYYNVQAIAPVDTSEAAKNLMLQTMLEQRLRLKYHWQQTQLPIYALTAGKDGVKLPAGRPNQPGVLGRQMSAAVFRSNSSTLAELASFLTYNMDRPVFDMTGTTATFQMQFNWSGALYQPRQDEEKREGALVMSSPALIAPGEVARSLKPLGLQFESRKVAVKILVVDDARMEPTPN